MKPDFHEDCVAFVNILGCLKLFVMALRTLRNSKCAVGLLLRLRGDLAAAETLPIPLFSTYKTQNSELSRATRSSISHHQSYSTTNGNTEPDEHLSSFNYIKVEIGIEGVAWLTLNRPESLNALSSSVMQEVISACLYLDRHSRGARVIVITGTGTKAFAAGADIKEMASMDYGEAYNKGLLNGWEALRSVRKPVIAAVNGIALGGGCELAMMCDIIIASDTAVFGQPEITLGVTPGMGGTQRLTRAVGKSRAMELLLTGGRLGAAEAAKIGLISRVVPASDLHDEVQRVATKIASYSTPVVAKIKDCILASFEAGLAEGIKVEKREFWSCFALQDQKEGMSAFIQKREPHFKDC